MNRNPINWPTVAIVAVVGLFVAWQSGGQASVPSSAPLVATVDLEKVMLNMAGFVEANEELEKLGERFESEDLQLEESITLLQEDLEQAPKGSQTETDLLRELHWTSRQREAFLEFAGRKLSVEKARMLRRLFDEVSTVINSIAEDAGLDLVIVDDASIAIPDEVTQEALMRHIATRRTMYSSDRIDITDEVIARLK